MLLTITFFLMIFIVIVLFIAGVSLISIKMKTEREKFSVFECGFDLLSSLRLPFSLNFYFIIIIFLIFDVELVLLLPFVYNMKLLSLGSIMLLMILFFVILIVGFIYEWLAGLLNWLV
uniref:NADH-ubiquinone oxidoreductase chain 3 n=1 Tax=Crenidorsum turpiniae TaxID=2774091 RepID=A0A7L7SGF6_9HEMI|nr:NADH dehydrogenase subunit 3 [Crenidorsum turpiniae]QNV48542.1 NADH dehydrogenase subunit 3 [Crenidorsum turpiniae]